MCAVPRDARYDLGWTAGAIISAAGRDRRNAVCQTRASSSFAGIATFSPQEGPETISFYFRGLPYIKSATFSALY